MNIKKTGILMTLTLAVVFSSSCAIMPLTRKFSKWSAESCGRHNFGARLCSSLVELVTIPVYALTLVADYPISLVEFFGGVQLVDDPLVKTAMTDFDKKTFAGNDHDAWTAQRKFDRPDSFDVEHLTAAGETERYEARIGFDRRLELSRVD